MKCFNCGAELSDDTKFCSYCGVKIPTRREMVEESDEDEDSNMSDTESGYEELGNTYSPDRDEGVSAIQHSLWDKAKSKIRDCWGKLSIFGKISAIGISIAIFLSIVAFLAGRAFSGVIAIIWIISTVVAILMRKNIIHASKAWLPQLIALLSVALILPYLCLFKINIADYEKYAWSEVALADVLPAPESPYGEIVSNSKSYLLFQVNKITVIQYNNYVEACKEKGFTIDEEIADDFFFAYNEQGYELSLNYYNNDNKMRVSLSAGKKLGTLSWPNSGLAQIVPMPKSTVGEIEYDDEKRFEAYIGDTPIEEFNLYVDACLEKGFTVDSDKTDKHFFAKNADGYRLSVDYQGNNVILVSLDEPEYSVTIQVQCIENWIFSKYDVDVYIDDSYKGTIIHGDSATFDFTLTEGSYTLRFVSSEDDELDGEIKLHVQKNESLSYKISCSSSGINIEALTDDITSEKPEKNGFDSTSNMEVSVGLASFEIPSYWAADITEADHYRAYAETSGKVAMLNILANYDNDDPVSFDILQVENDLGLMEKSVRSGFGACGEIHSEVFDNGSVKGYIYSSAFEQDGYRGQMKTAMIPSVKDNKWITITLLETDNTEYSYFADYSEIMNSVVLASDSTEDTQPTEESSMPPSASDTSSKRPMSYSTNDKDTVKNGNAGVYSYRNRGKQYYTYYIIDFDGGYVYRFCDGNGDATCDRVKIVSGDLNDVLMITYRDGNDTWSYGIHFKWKRQPDHLIVQDEDGLEWDFYSTDLDEALELRDLKTIHDY